MPPATKFNQIFQQLGIIGNARENNQLTNLMKRPSKEPRQTMAHVVAYKKNSIHQADLLYLPTDPMTKDKYALVVVDIATRLCDAVPLKERDALTVSRAIQKLYQTNQYLKKPLRVEVDSGSEFKGVFKDVMERLHVSMKKALPNRHRQQSVVETRTDRLAL
jgi:hypothetical protein